MPQPSVPGIHITLAGRDLVFAPLSLGSVQAFQNRLKDFAGDVSPESIDLVLDAAQASLARNYHDAVTRAELADMLDLGNMLDVMQAVMDVSGLLRKKLEADQGVGLGEARLAG